MAALAAATVSSPWIPEDDLLLKNSVEAGASLEALAKGAVRFSRRFTVRELQDRWHTLLYDPVISAEASACMFGVEQPGCNPSLKSQKNYASLENAGSPGKRKIESVRRLYNAMRKKLCTALGSSSGLSFIGSVNANDCLDSIGGYQEGVEPYVENPIESFDLGGYVQDHFGFQENVEHHGPSDDSLVENLMNNCYNEFLENGQFSPLEQSGLLECVEQNDAHEGSPHAFAEALDDFGICSVEGLESSNAFPDGNSVFNSIGCSSLEPGMGISLWETMEDVPAPTMPMKDCPGDDRGLDAEDGIWHIDVMDDKRISTSEYNVVDSGCILESRHSNFEMNDSTTASRSNLADVSEAILDFPEVNENIFMDVGGGDTVNRSCYDTVNSLLEISPNDVHVDDKINAKEPKALVSDTCFGTSKGDCLAEFEIFLVNQSQSALKKKESMSSSETNMPQSASVPGFHSPKRHHEVILCTLNTEDPEIPCNDHVVFGKPSALPAPPKSCLEVHDQASTFAYKKNSTEPSVIRSEDNPTALEIVKPDDFPETNRHVRVESHDGESHLMNRQADNTHIEPCQHELPSTFIQDGINEDPSHAYSDTDLQKCQETTIEALLGLEENPTTSDLEQYESEDDVPNFSDIEALILDMDLCPDDSDSCVSREVARYQPEDAKRAFIRLEQCAQASLQRAIASQGAFAVFYGRCLKYYIRETEVVIGRATGDADVDIDLGREGRANKISRRQALIKMEDDGVFYIKNLGRNSMFINGQEIFTGQKIGLSSSSLIEIRDLAFAFEINHKSVRRYLRNINQKNKGGNHKFEWSEEPVQ